MTSNSLGNAIRIGIVLAAVALCSMAPARATLYTGAWDPQYGFPFTGTDPIGFDLGWRGEALFFVPDACVPTSLGTSIVSFLPFAPPNPCGTPIVQSAIVELYDLASSSNALETIDFDFGLAGIFGLRFEDGELTGVFTAPSLPTVPSAVTSTDLSLQFVFPPHILLSLAFDEIPMNYAGPLLYSVSEQEICHTYTYGRQTYTKCKDKLIIDVSNVGSPAGAPTFTINRVPEPGILALLASALLTLGWATRTRRGIRVGMPAASSR